MGASYASVIVLGSDEPAVAATCSRPAFIASDDAAVVVFTDEDDTGGEPTAGAISQALSCRTLFISVHDSDLFVVQVYANGSLTFEGCVPDPVDYFGEDLGIFEPAPPMSPEELVVAVGRGSVDDVRDCLFGDYVFAEERHSDLLKALGLPTWSVGHGFRYLDWGDSPYEGPDLRKLTSE